MFKDVQTNIIKIAANEKKAADIILASLDLIDAGETQPAKEALKKARRFLLENAGIVIRAKHF